MAKSSALYLESAVLLSEPVTAAGALAGNRFVDRSGDYPGANGDYAAGVTQMAAAAGDLVSIATIGIIPVEVGAAISAVDTPLIADTAGKVRPASDLAIASGATPVTSGAANGASVLSGGIPPQHIVGYAMDTATGSGTEFIRVRLA